MGVFFSGKELIEVAINIEQNGITFYQSLANKTGNSAAREIYNYLAEQEKKHLAKFQDFQKTTGGYQPIEDYTGESALYLKAFVKHLVFTDDAMRQLETGQEFDELKAIETGINAEKDSILFYSEMQSLIPQSDQHVVYDITSEEKRHLLQLSDLKEKLKVSK